MTYLGGQSLGRLPELSPLQDRTIEAQYFDLRNRQIECGVAFDRRKSSHRSGQHLLAPGVEQPSPNAMPIGDDTGNRPVPQRLTHDPQLLLAAPSATGLRRIVNSTRSFEALLRASYEHSSMPAPLSPE